MMEGPGADSEEKHEPVSDIDTAVVVVGLKALDPEWPIREGDWYLTHRKVLGNQRRQLRHGPAGHAGEDRTQCFSLLIAGALTDVGSHRPISFSHWSWRMDCERHIEPSSVMPS